MRRIALVVPTVAVAGLVLLAGCSSGGDSCLTGSWAPTNMDEEYGTLKDMGGSIDFTLKFDGNNISLDYMVSVPKTEFSDESKAEASVKGKYSVSDDKIKVTDVTSSAKIDGEEVDDEEMDGLSDLDEGESSYTCSGDKLTVDGQEYTKK